MNAHLYICDITFAHNGTDDDTMVYDKLLRFREFFTRVSDTESQDKQQDFFYLMKENFGNTPILMDGTTVVELLDYQTCMCKFHNHDLATVFWSLFKRCRDTHANISDMIEYLALEDVENLQAIVVMNKSNELPETIQVLSTYESWLAFRRYYLAKYPVSVDNFLSEAKRYFPQLLIHDSTKDSLKDVLLSHTHGIVKCLSVLNDNLIKDFRSQHTDMVNFLPWFSAQYKFDGASLNGGGNKERFTYTFVGKEGDSREAYCEAHLKLNSNDCGDSRQYCRIYFAKPNSSDINVYVGAICRHK